MEKKNPIVFYAFIIVFTLFVGCKKETESPIDLGLNYFPTAIGMYQQYEVDSIVWDDFNSTIDTFHYQVRFVIDSSYLDNTGRPSFFRIKYTSYDTLPFAYNRTSSVTPTTERVEMVENDFRYVKLVFPVFAGSKWNSNGYNTMPATNALYTDVDYSWELNSIVYDSCAQITFVNEVNLIMEVIHEEVYARNVGMIYSLKVDKRQYTTGLRGYSVMYKLVSHGME